MWVNPDSCNSTSDLIFLGLDPTAGKACGLTKVVLTGTLEAVYTTLGPTYPPNPPLPIVEYYPIADIEIALYIPWFIWS